MIKPEIPKNESVRLKALKNLGIVDSKAEKEFDDLASLAAYICDVPIALISFLEEERQWFKSTIGINFCDTTREVSFCAHAINQPQELMIVEDARKDPRFAKNPLTLSTEQPVIFYAGMPLTDKNGNSLGTLCVIDHQPRILNDRQKIALKTITNQVINLLEIRSKNNNLKAIEKELRLRNELLKDFAGVVSHDMKMPLTNMIITADILKEKYSNQLDDKGKEYLQYMKQSSFSLSDYISKILTYYESDKLSDQKHNESFDIHHLLEEIVDLFNIQEDCDINFPDENIELNCNRVALEQILLNLIGNSLKYNDKKKIEISINCHQDDSFYYFTVTDNGMGIPENKQKEIFKLFSTVTQLDRNGNKGNGIGLSTVKKLIMNLGGDIEVNSNVGEKTSFSFSIKKSNE
ncbi:sensor histidine kinase [Mesonia aestuariivivens]|uniref:histidine kinase n=1 Tax=Mesonia aestuariivivens TaxID=2796128 RepID=A0ABS6W4K4_9FLAO|nr:GAF domain-containing sensor histidine kinase [Mesonia aestuariivivens]MBW2962785.1 GAF domain-containing sensor histidine kinase [Mesonia aestuariivivens]